GDDVFGDDPTVNRLQARAAEIFGFETALLFPSGTQSNLAALMSHCQRGDEVILGAESHSYRYEAGGLAVLGSIPPQAIANRPDGTLALTEVEAPIKPDDPHFARTVLLGSTDFIQRARRARKILGGAMRQAGVIAAAGLYALENNVERLRIDHENAGRLARGLRELKLEVQHHTNMVMVRIPPGIAG